MAICTSATPSRSASIFGLAEEYGGTCNLRFDDTNPTKEEQEYVDAIMQDVRWLGFDWEDRLYHASDYFDQLYDFAERLIQDGKAYVDSLSADEIREHRGTLTQPGRESPYRSRPVEENLDLFRRMRGRRVSRWHARPARPDRHGVAQYPHARSHPLPHPAGRPSAYGRPVVHLPHVRFHALPVGCAGAHHALHLHAGVREQPAALRLGAGPAARALPGRINTNSPV